MKKTYKNTLPKGLKVEDVNVRVENGEVVVDVYFDLYPKDGDFLASKKGSIFIYKPTDTSDSYGCYCACLEDGDILIKGSSDWALKVECRYATPAEKSVLLELLERKYRKKWNPEKKCLEDIYTPKFGDIVKVILDDINNNSYKRNYMICIYPNKNFSKTDGFFNLPFLSLNGKLVLDSTGGSNHCNSIIPASESEKQELFDKLAEVGKRWNPDTKQLEDIRWRAKIGESYYVVNMVGSIRKMIEEGLSKDDVYYSVGNYFKSSEAACRLTNQVKELFKNSKAE